MIVEEEGDYDSADYGLGEGPPAAKRPKLISTAEEVCLDSEGEEDIVESSAPQPPLLQQSVIKSTAATIAAAAQQHHTTAAAETSHKKKMLEQYFNSQVRSKPPSPPYHLYFNLCFHTYF